MVEERAESRSAVEMPGPGARPPAFEAEDLTRVYGEGAATVHALRGVSLTVQPGEFLVLLGPSGSGKSTLLNILGGLDRPSEGRLRALGEDLTGASDSRLTKFRRDHVGFVFQFYNLMPGLTARENVELVTDIATAPLAAAEALELVGLGARVDHFPAQLSGGEQQRVAIARAIAKQPPILLCDEPTGALDSKTGARVLEALRSANDRLATTTLVITHNVAIADMADRVVHLADGRVSSITRPEVRKAPSELEW